MSKALIDSSTYFDMLKAPRHRHAEWSQNTSSQTVRYLKEHPQLTLSAFTIFEIVDGFKRKGQDAEIAVFLSSSISRFEVIYPEKNVFAMAGQINALLILSGSAIGVLDSFIAATAITHNLTLVSANTRHFERLAAIGFPLKLENWREP